MTDLKRDEQLIEKIIRQAMRAAIPDNDYGSRMAIQYAPEIAEFIRDWGYVFTETADRVPDRLPLAIQYMDRKDRPVSQ